METFIKSPLNYTGGKYRLLPQILPLFPQKVGVFHDIFCGGANVCINVSAKQIVANDTNEVVIRLFNYFKKTPVDDVMSGMLEIIQYYQLSESNIKGYDFYECESSSGLSPYNKEKFSVLKKDYNNPVFNKFNKDLMFYTLIVYGFNNQIRFNRKGEYNMPVGKRDFNTNMQKNVKRFVTKLNESNIVFENKSYEEMIIDKNSFIYADPPYLISTATYNESDGWNETKEKHLLSFLSNHQKDGGMFALSNVVEHKNKKNEMLLEWANENHFKVHPLNFSYSNSSYHGKDKESITKEVLITNY